MSVVSAIRDMLSRGLTVEQALIAAEAMEQSLGRPKSNAQRQADWRARQKDKRNENNENVTFVTDRRNTEDAPTHAEPEPNITTTPPTSEAKASSVGAPSDDLPLTGELLLPIAKPKPPPSASRGCRIPPGFPGDDERAWARDNLGFTDDDFEECATEFRDYWSGVSGRHGVKCDWPATFRNGARKYRPRRGARQAYAAGNQRSDGSLLGAYQRGAARVRQANDVSRQRSGIFDHRDREMEMQYGIPAE